MDLFIGPLQMSLPAFSSVLTCAYLTGTIHSGQSRLLYSSAQVEYIRYWLHAMGLTKEPLPLPSSDYLLTKSDLRNISRATYKSEKELKDALKV